MGDGPLTNGRPTVVCVTPVRNEAWILERFLACAATWADWIVVADQQSTDGSREIASRHPKVRLVDNPDRRYDEGARQQLLLDEARKLPAPRMVVALDADEALTANFASSQEWAQALKAAPGTVLRFRWVNVLPGFERAWIPPERLPLGYVDDGTPHIGTTIHSTRLPLPDGAPVLDLDEVKVLHLQYLDWRRMKSKQRWYECWERLNVPGKRPIQLYRQYHHMDAIPPERITAVDRDWIEGYQREGVDLGEVTEADWYPWDADVARWIAERGPVPFRKLDIWDVDWARAGQEMGVDGILPRRDPRRPWERAIHRWLRRTQGRRHDRRVRWLQRLLIPLGW